MKIIYTAIPRAGLLGRRDYSFNLGSKGGVTREAGKKRSGNIRENTVYSSLFSYSQKTNCYYEYDGIKNLNHEINKELLNAKSWLEVNKLALNSNEENKFCHILLTKKGTNGKC